MKCCFDCSDAKHSYDIYKYTKMAIDPAVPVVRYEMPRSALELLRRHAPQFDTYIADDYKVGNHFISFAL